jgi:hypothetical protein
MSTESEAMEGTIYYGDGIRPFSFEPMIRKEAYLCVAQQFPDDPVDTRRLVKRVFETRGHMNLCHEYVATRTSTEKGWSFDAVLFLEGEVTPYPWHYNNSDPIPSYKPHEFTGTPIYIPLQYAGDYLHEWKRMEPLSARHCKQDLLSQVQ